LVSEIWAVYKQQNTYKTESLQKYIFCDVKSRHAVEGTMRYLCSNPHARVEFLAPAHH